jgi:hypothetical protein
MSELIVVPVAMVAPQASNPQCDVLASLYRAACNASGRRQADCIMWKRAVQINNCSSFDDLRAGQAARLAQSASVPVVET